MRKIKFRGYGIVEKKWFYGNLVEGNAGYYITVADYNETDGDIIRYHPIETKTIGQFTGLYDKNGKEIYEDDIFTIDGKYPKLVKYINEWSAFCVANLDTLTNPLMSKWRDKYKYQQLSPLWWSDFKNEIEVIGNIHDNPELLKGE